MLPSEVRTLRDHERAQAATFGVWDGCGMDVALDIVWFSINICIVMYEHVY